MTHGTKLRHCHPLRIKCLCMNLQISGSGVFHVRLMASSRGPEAIGGYWDWLPGCTSSSGACNATLLVCLGHAHTSSIPSSSASSLFQSSSSSSSSSSSVQPLCVTPTPGGSEASSDLVARLPVEFTWPVRALYLPIARRTTLTQFTTLRLLAEFRESGQFDLERGLCRSFNYFLRTGLPGTIGPPNLAPTSSRRGHLAPLTCKKNLLATGAPPDPVGWLPPPQEPHPRYRLYLGLGLRPSGLRF